MLDADVTPGWADNLHPGDKVIVEDAVVDKRRPSRSYYLATVDSVTKTEVRVNGRRYRRGRGRSKYVPYFNEGRDIERLTVPDCGRIIPATRPNQRRLDKLADADAALDHLDHLATKARKLVTLAVEEKNPAALEAAIAALDPQ